LAKQISLTSQTKRAVLISQIIGSSGSTLAGVNSNFGDTATFDTKSLSLSNVPSICDTYQVRLQRSVYFVHIG
jgi:hypothetical protein